MKKLFLILIGLLISASAFSQSFMDDVWQCLRQGQAPKARTFIEKNMPANQENAAAWLLRGNVYISLYDYDQKKIKADPNYTPRYPDAIMTANESFVKALALDSEVKPMTGMISAKYGQVLCADPMYDMAGNFIKKGELDKALEYYKMAANNYLLSPEYMPNAAASYVQMATIYAQKNDKENYKNMLAKAVECKTAYPAIYTELYYIYKDANDTVNCENILKNGFAILPVAGQNELIAPQMDYFDMTGQNEALIAYGDSIMKINNDTTFIGNYSIYLTNSKLYSKAEEILNNALATNPNSFILNKQMGYRFLMEGTEYEGEKADAAKKAKQWTEMAALKQKALEIYGQSVTWYDKAYAINGNDRETNISLHQLKVRLGQPVSDALKAKYDSYMKH